VIIVIVIIKKTIVVGFMPKKIAIIPTPNLKAPISPELIGKFNKAPRRRERVGVRIFM
jgi:hypothetical protein